MGQTARPTRAPTPKVIPIPNMPTARLRTIAGCTRALPALALRYPVNARARATAAKHTGTRHPVGGNRIATSGSMAPTKNATNDAAAACHGLVSASGSSPSSASA